MSIVVLTGATGFVGRHLLSELVHRGHTVRATVRDAASGALLRARLLAEMAARVEVHVIGDLTARTVFTPALIGADAVLHLAARAHQIPDRAPDPLAAFQEVNTEATRRLAEQAAAAGVRHVVFVSSVGAVADRSSRPLVETDPCHPSTPYGQSKWEAELALREATEGSSTMVTILRPPLVYGPGNPGNMGRLDALVRRGIPFPVGEVSNARSLVFVGNLCDALRACLLRPEAFGETFFVSDGVDLSTADLVRLMASARGKRARVLHVPRRVLNAVARGADAASAYLGHPLPFGTEVLGKLTGTLQVDSRHIRERLGWEPPFTVTEALRSTFSPSP